MDAQIKLQKMRADAEEKARKIIADATKTAKNIIDHAAHSRGSSGSGSSSSGSSSAGGKQHQKLNVHNSILLKPTGTPTGDVDSQALGLAPTMSIDTTTISKGHSLAKKADIRHEDFENQHEIDCKGPICGGKNGKKVTATTSK